MFGVTPQGNTASPQLVDQYKRYVIDSQTNGQTPVSYDEWVKLQIRQVQENAGRFF